MPAMYKTIWLSDLKVCTCGSLILHLLLLYSVSKLLASKEYNTQQNWRTWLWGEKLAVFQIIQMVAAKIIAKCQRSRTLWNKMLVDLQHCLDADIYMHISIIIWWQGSNAVADYHERWSTSTSGSRRLLWAILVVPILKSLVFLCVTTCTHTLNYFMHFNQSNLLTYLSLLCFLKINVEYYLHFGKCNTGLLLNICIKL